MPGARRKRKSNSKFSLLVGIAIIGGIVFLLQNKATTASSTLNPQDIPQSVSTLNDYWAATDFNYRRKLTVPNKANTVMAYSFDHAALVKQHQSQPDGSDLKVVAQIDNATEIMPTELSAMNSANTKIRFDASKYPDATYYLYFGNKRTDSSKVLGASATNGKTETIVSAGDIDTPIIDVQADNYWQLAYKDGVKFNLNLDLKAPLEIEKLNLYYVLDGQDSYHQITNINQLAAKSELNLGKISNGAHTFYIVAVQAGKTYRSATLKFRVSKPLFVAWTVDWEGYDVKDSVLEAFSSISQKYTLPITQFFNPRIYIDPTVATFRRNQLTNWVKARASQNGDEIAMHMHMQYDMVRAAGVDPVSSPRWGTGQDGYDVLSLNYNFDQFGQILKWGLQTFAAQGLPVPKGFRAGGWFANLDTLKAEAALGFTYDSSGREEYTFGSKKIKGPWTLPHTTQPYKPSTTNQNSSQPAPNLDLWEMPDNGNDSYWFSQKDLIDRFYANYTNPGHEIANPTLVTYLSHPDWFYVDQPKIEALFTEISKYAYSQDKGPVVFTTLSNALSEYQN